MSMYFHLQEIQGKNLRFSMLICRFYNGFVVIFIVLLTFSNNQSAGAIYNRQASEELARRNNYPTGGEHDQKLQKKFFEALHCSKGVVKPNSLSLYVAKPCSLWLYIADNYSLSLSLSLCLS